MGRTETLTRPSNGAVPSITVSPLTTALSALVPVDEDSRVLDVARRLAQANALAEAARERRQGLQRIRDSADAPELDRLQAELDLRGAIVSEREAEIDRLKTRDEAAAPRAQVLNELRAAIDSTLRRAAMAVQAAMERVRDTEHAALLAVVERAQALTGSYDPRVEAMVWAPFLASNGSDDQVA